MPNSVALSAYRTTNLCVRSIADVSLNVGKVGGGFFSRFFGTRSECLSIQVRNKHTDIKLNKVYNDINKSIQQARVNKDEWFVQERTSLLSSEVNKIIDRACIQKQMDITKHQKERIFRNISYKLGGIQLDSKCTQSSINQMVQNNQYVTSKVDKLISSKNMERAEKNEIKNIVKYKLTELVYEKQFKGENIEQLRTIAAKEAINQLKRYSAPF